MSRLRYQWLSCMCIHLPNITNHYRMQYLSHLCNVTLPKVTVAYNKYFREKVKSLIDKKIFFGICVPNFISPAINKSNLLTQDFYLSRVLINDVNHTTCFTSTSTPLPFGHRLPPLTILIILVDSDTTDTIHTNHWKILNISISQPNPTIPIIPLQWYQPSQWS